MRLAFALVLFAAGPAALAQSPFVGTWEGPLDLGPQTVRFVLHVAEGPQGLAVTADSPDQGGFGIRAAEASAEGGRLRASFPDLRAAFEGRLAADGRMEGTLTQAGRAFPAFTLARAAQGAEPSPALAPYAGPWSGVLDAGAARLPLVLRLAPGSSPDALAATLDSPSQGAFGIPTAGATLGPDGRLTIEVPAVNGRLEGALAGDSLVGTWTQGGSLPLVLRRGETAAEQRRPQTPQPPFPYRAEEVAFESAGGVTLAGTLTLPEGPGPFAAAVLVSGSGPQDRDETIFGHKPFAVLADRLTRAGFAVLRYDDRGTAASTGDFASATTADFVDDALAAVRFLGARADIGRVGIIGHSEGGLVAPWAAEREPAVGFVVLLAGPAVPGTEILAEQNTRAFILAGMSEEGARAYGARFGRVLDALAAIPPGEPVSAAVAARALADLRAAADAMTPADRAVYSGGNEAALDQTLAGLVAQLGSPWMRGFLARDPRPALQRLSVPTLAVFGGLDFQVPADQNEGPMRAALAGNPRAEVVTLPGLNHLFQTASTGGLEEYGALEETLAPVLLDTVEAWMRAHAGKQ